MTLNINVLKETVACTAILISFPLLKTLSWYSLKTFAEQMEKKNISA